MPSDVELLARAGRGDVDAFGQLFDQHARAVFGYAYGLTHQADDSQDLVQDVFLTAWQKAADIQLVGESMLPWLLVCTRNHAANLRRKNLVRQAVPIDDLTALPDPVDAFTQADHAHELEWVFAQIAALGPIDRQLAELCLCESMSYPEAARRLGLSVSAVAKRIQRIRDRLRPDRERGARP